MDTRCFKWTSAVMSKYLTATLRRTVALLRTSASSQGNHEPARFTLARADRASVRSSAHSGGAHLGGYSRGALRARARGSAATAGQTPRAVHDLSPFAGPHTRTGNGRVHRPPR